MPADTSTISAIRATITELKARPGRVGDYSIARLQNVLDNCDPDYDGTVGALVRSELASRDVPVDCCGRKIPYLLVGMAWTCPECRTTYALR